MNIRTASWRFIGDRTGWPIMARTAFWSGRHPALLRAPSPATPGEAVTAHPRASLGPAIAFSLRDANAGHAVCGFMDNPFRGRLRRHVRQTGFAHNSTGASSAEGRGDIVFCWTPGGGARAG